MSKLWRQFANLFSKSSGEETKPSGTSRVLPIEESPKMSSGLEDGVKLTGVVIGAGSRGQTYASFSSCFPESFQIVGVVEPNKTKRELMKKRFDIPDSHTFTDCESLCSMERLSDVAIIATPDIYHHQNTIMLANKGYHILLEKPMATTEEHCKEIVSVCRKNNVMLAVCHVLRYLPQVNIIDEAIKSGRIGKVVHIQHTEPVGYWHFAHSFVRGNWRNESGSAFSLLTKCCHDFDLIYHWMLPNRVKSVSSFGSLFHFKKENKPANASSRCVDCPVEPDCAYSATQIYGRTYGWPTSVICDLEDLSPPERKVSVAEALRTGPYGRCVYECDNDVCDNQITNLQFEDGATASITMVAFTKSVCARYTRVFGTEGELYWDEAEGEEVRFYHFATRKTEILQDRRIIAASYSLSGHGGGDFLTIQSFLKAVATGDEKYILTGPEKSLESHLLTFAAEKSRKAGQVLNI